MKMQTITKRLCKDEPMHCWRKGCKEELNALMRYTIDLGDGFVFEMWLCYNCMKKIDKNIALSKNYTLKNA